MNKVLFWFVGLISIYFFCSFLFGCNPTVSLEIQDDECLTCFPECTIDGEYECVRSNGVACEGCIVGCLAGSDLRCEGTRVSCHNYVEGGPIEVPSVCLNEEF